MKYRLTIECKNTGRRVIAENVSTSFKCPACELPMIYLPQEMKLGAHGHSSVTLKHQLTKVEELEK